MFGLAVAREDEAVGAGVRAVQHAEPICRGLDLDPWPDRAVDDGEGAEALHHVRVGLVEQIAGQAAPRRGVEVAVSQEERQLVGRAFG